MGALIRHEEREWMRIFFPSAWWCRSVSEGGAAVPRAFPLSGLRLTQEQLENEKRWRELWWGRSCNVSQPVACNPIPPLCHRTHNSWKQVEFHVYEYILFDIMFFFFTPGTSVLTWLQSTVAIQTKMSAEVDWNVLLWFITTISFCTCEKIIINFVQSTNFSLKNRFLFSFFKGPIPINSISLKVNINLAGQLPDHSRRQVVPGWRKFQEMSAATFYVLTYSSSGKVRENVRTSAHVRKQLMCCYFIEPECVRCFCFICVDWLNYGNESIEIFFKKGR